MKKRKFIGELNPRISPMVYMQNPQDLEEAYDYAARAATGVDLSKQAEKEVSMAEQIEALQIQLAELTTGQTTSQVNYVMPPQQQQNPPSVYYTPEANWVPPLNQPYETNPPRQNNWNQSPPQNNQDRWPYQSDRRMDGQINGNCHNCGKRGHMAKNCWS